METILFLILIAGVWVVVRQRQKKRMYQYSYESFGKEKGGGSWREEEDSISFYHRSLGEEEGIDEITWNDLNMDGIYNSMNVTYSNCGAEYLYALLRRPVFQKEPLQERGRLSEAFRENTGLRVKVQAILLGMGKIYKASAYEMLCNCKNAPSPPVLPHVGIFLGTLLSLGLFWYYPWIGGAIFFSILALSFLTYYRALWRIPESNRWYLKNFAKMLKAAKELTKIKDRELMPYLEELEDILSHFRGVRLQSLLLASGTGIVSDAGELLLDYVRILTHGDVLVTGSIAARVRRNFAQAERLFEILGLLDAMISAANYKSLLPCYCEPDFGEGPITVEELYHPQVKDPVSNSLSIARGIILTGSNASGKSTFLKAVALNAIFSQTMYLSFSKSCRENFYHIYTSMALRDSIEEGDSYFIAEIKSIRRIMEAGKEKRVLCCIDEVFRGTNTPERIAASAEILYNLSGDRTICLAATHDLELPILLEKFYDSYYFSEKVQKGELLFDYLLKKGTAETGNALRLLKAYGYPKEIIEKAERRLEAFRLTGKWE